MIFILLVVVYLAIYFTGATMTFQRMGYVQPIFEVVCRQTFLLSTCSGCRCKNCGGAPRYHKSGLYYSIREPSGECNGCSNYAQTGVHHESIDRAQKAFSCLVGWWIIVPGFYAKKYWVESERDFFKPPPTIETKDAKIARLIKEKDEYRLETDRRLAELGIEV